MCLGDIDNDGDIDAYLPNADQANRLIRNDYAETGAAGFTDITLASGTGDAGGARGCTMGDYDNDGWLDIYVSNGGLSNVLINDIVEDLPSIRAVLHRRGAGRQRAASQQRRRHVFRRDIRARAREGMSIGAGVASGDVNGDGFTDIVGTARTFYNRGEMLSEPQRNFLWLNQGNGNHWIKVRLDGQRVNARIRVEAGDLVQWREIFSSTGYNSVDEPAPIFGLGEAATAWTAWTCAGPTGSEQTVLTPPRGSGTARGRGRRGGLPVARRHDPDHHRQDKQHGLRAGYEQERRPGRRCAEQFAAVGGGKDDARRAEQAQQADHRAALGRRRFLAHQRHAAHHAAGHGRAQQGEQRQHAQVQRRFHEIHRSVGDNRHRRR